MSTHLEEELIKIISKVRENPYTLSDKSLSDLLDKLESTYPNITNVLFKELGKLTPEEILELAKKNDAPICL
jgi:DNA gyrase/topoisomerase IV subunit B